jgi:hypothetical protein
VLVEMAWQPLESVCPTWKSEGWPARVTRAVGGGLGRRVERDQDGAELQVLGGGRRQEPRARRGAEEIGGSGKTMEDPVAKSRKLRGLTVTYR